MSEERTLDITEDLTAEGLAEVAFGTEVVVMWDGMAKYGIITGYDEATCLFEIDPVVKDDNERWVEKHITTEEGDGWTRSIQLSREHFVVFGPANREHGDPGDNRMPPRVQEVALGQLCEAHGLGLTDLDGRYRVFASCAADLSRVGMGDFMSTEPTFKVRLDVDAREAPGPGRMREATEIGSAYPRSFRILVRPVMAPILHDEIEVLLKIVAGYGLQAAIVGDGRGIDIRIPGDVDPR